MLYNLDDDINPQLVVSAGDGATLLFNRDFVNQIAWSNSPGLGVEVNNNGTDYSIIDPLGSVTVPGDEDVYVIGITGQPTIDVGSAGLAGVSPILVAQAMATSGIAEGIALALEQTGIPLLAGPQVIYNLNSTPVTTPVSKVGFTVPPSSFQSGCYYAGLTQNQGDQGFISAVGVSQNGFPAVTKKFWNDSDWSLTKNNLANYVTQGTQVIFCIRPSCPGIPAPGGGAITNAEKTNLTNFLNGLIALGFNSTNCVIFIFQEANNGKNFGSTGTLAQQLTNWTNCLSAYGPIVNTSGLPLAISVGASQGDSNCQSYINAALGIAGLTFTAVSVDYYYGSFKNGFTLDATAAIADAHSLEYGLSEFGCHVTPDDYNSYFNYIIGFFQARISAGKKNFSVNYYDGICSATGAGDLASPILTPTDPRVPLYVTLFNTLTTTISSSGGLTLPHGQITVVTPTLQSPIAGLGVADQLSYELAMGLVAGVSSTIPFVSATMAFYDFDDLVANQPVIANPTYRVPMGANGDPVGPSTIFGGGPMRGAFMQIKLKNHDTVDAQLDFLQLVGTSRVSGIDNWSWDTGNSPAIPNFTTAANAFSSLQLAHNAGTTDVNPNSNLQLLMGLFAGTVFIRYKQQGASAVLFEIAPQPPLVFGSQQLSNISVSNGGEYEAEILLPRAPCLLTMANQDATHTAQVFFSIICKQDA